MNAAEEQQRNKKTGMSMTLVGGLLLTVDAPLIRLASTDAWTVIAVRGIFAFTALWFFWQLFQRHKDGARPFVNGYLSVLISCLTALISVMLINAIHLTSVANVVFLMAFNPMFAALLSWFFLGERQSKTTIFAILLAIIGVSIIVWDSINVGSPLGDFLALGVSLTLAIILTIVRRSGTDQSMSPAFGSLLAAAAVLAFADPISLPAVSWGWLALNGLIVIPLSSALMILGPKYVAAPTVAMFFLLETVLTPVWMWLIFDELPTYRGFIGGAIVITALLTHSIWSFYGVGEQRFQASR